MEHPDIAFFTAEEGPDMRLTHRYQTLWQTWNSLCPKWECSVPSQSW